MGIVRQIPLLTISVLLATCGRPDTSAGSGKQAISKTREAPSPEDNEGEDTGFKPDLNPKAGEKVEYILGKKHVPRSEFEAMLRNVNIATPAASHSHGHGKADCTYARKNGGPDPDCVPGEFSIFSIEFDATHRTTGEPYIYGRKETKRPGAPITTHRLSLKKNFHTKVMRSKRP